MNATVAAAFAVAAPPLPVWHSPYHPIVQAIIWIVAALLSLETIVGNAMVIIAYKLERSISKQVSNRYIVSLAVSDLIIGIEGIPLFTVYVVNGDRWPLGSIACETWLFLDYTLCLVSILTVLLITADRYASVCHTAKYLKWQSPTKVQVFIFLSWILPAVMFGLMIYGWSFMSGDDSRAPDECYAPFLSNPYVNMGMYVAYYWTTLVAMLILYKGIHKAAKNLEKKAKAKEHRHIALLLTQRLGTQVGVSLMLQSKRADSLRNEDPKDSGYHTNNLPTSTQNAESATTEPLLGRADPAPLIVRREPLSLKRSASPSSFSFRRHRVKRASVRSVKSIPTPTIMENMVTMLRGKSTKSASKVGNGAVKSAALPNGRQISVEEELPEPMQPLQPQQRELMRLRRDQTATTIESLSTLFHDESLSSILQFAAPTVESEADPTDLNGSDTTSIILSRRIHTPSLLTITPGGADDTLWSERADDFGGAVPCALAEPSRVADTPHENGGFGADFDSTPPPLRAPHSSIASTVAQMNSIPFADENRLRESRRWFAGIRQRIPKLKRAQSRKRSVRRSSRKYRPTSRSRSVSSSSSDSSSVEESPPKNNTPKRVPTVTVTRERRGENKPSVTSQSLSPDRSGEPFLNALGKISNISSFTKDVKERTISSLLSPITALNRGRKRTKAERRAHKAFRTITFIVGLFAILWSPYYVVATVYGFCKGECIPSVLYNLSYYMCYLNSSGNPFAYALANRQFRSAFLRMFRGNFRRVH